MRFSPGLVLVLTACWLAQAQAPAKKTVAQKAEDPKPDSKADPPASRLTIEPRSDKFTYDAEWRLIHAGTITIAAQHNHADLTLDSAGIVSSLIKIHDVYQANFDEGLCASTAVMDSQEGKRHHDTRITYDRELKKATYLERDVIRGSVLHSDQVEIPNCVHEVITAFLKLREMKLAPGQSTQIPMSDGRKSAQVKIEAQEREDVKTPTTTYKAIRYEANMLNGVIYNRKGRAYIWLTDDEKQLPVQIRLRMAFPIGTVTLQLSKEEH